MFSRIRRILIDLFNPKRKPIVRGFTYEEWDEILQKSYLPQAEKNLEAESPIARAVMDGKFDECQQ